jgi:hypothetical protein
MDPLESTDANPVRRSRRRWLQFSLRGFLVGLTIGCVWLGWKVEQAREQRIVAQAVRECGGGIWYDWQVDFSGFPDRIGPLIRYPYELPRPAWLHRLVGFDMFHNVEMVIFPSSETPEESIVESVPHLKCLPKLKAVWIGYWVSEETSDKLRAALPNCQVNAFASR